VQETPRRFTVQRGGQQMVTWLKNTRSCPYSSNKLLTLSETSCGRASTVALLLRHGADPFVADDDGMLPIHKVGHAVAFM
jgi:hypothetical protein